MNKKTTGIIATVASVLLCGCPGIFICLFGALTAVGQGTFNEESLPPTIGFALICLSFVFIAIPLAVGFFTLRVKPEDDAAAPAVVDVEPSPEPVKPSEPVDEEPLPPAS